MPIAIYTCMSSTYNCKDIMILLRYKLLYGILQTHKYSVSSEVQTSGVKTISEFAFYIQFIEVLLSNNTVLVRNKKILSHLIVCLQILSAINA